MQSVRDSTSGNYGKNGSLNSAVITTEFLLTPPFSSKYFKHNKRQ